MKITVAFISLFILLAPVLTAQEQEVYGSVTPKTGYELTGLAVEDFKVAEGTRALLADSVVMVRIAEVIRADLDFSPFYKNIPADSFFMRHMEINVMTLNAWKLLGAKYVVRGTCEFEGDNVTIKYEIVVADNGMVFGRGRFQSLANNDRRLAHAVANDIIYYLTGERGIYDTRICFITTRTGNKEIFLCDYDGAHVYQLTGNHSINLSPAFGPDNQKIIFTSFMNGDPQLFEYDLISGKSDPIAAYPGINSAARISPNNSEIVCALSRDGNSEIYLLHRNGKIKKRLTYTNSIESSPCWSPTGKEIAFTSDRTGTPQVYIMDRDGTNLRRITYQGSYNDSPDWHPKGDKLVFVSRVEGRFNICTIDVTGANFRVLTDLGTNENPHWAPDGNHIVFSSTRTGTSEIYLMDIFGNEEKRLTTGGGNSNPYWSPYSR